MHEGLTSGLSSGVISGRFHFTEDTFDEDDEQTN